MVQAFLSRRQLGEEEERLSVDGVPVPADIFSSTALMQAMAARHTAESLDEDHPSAATQVRQRASEDREDDADELPSSVSGVMMQVMQARQRAEEEEDRLQWAPAPPGSSALIQAMLARQQAQNEYDDGYWADAAVGAGPPLYQHHLNTY